MLGAAGLQVQASPVQVHLHSGVGAWEPTGDGQGGWQIDLDCKTGLEMAVSVELAPLAVSAGLFPAGQLWVFFSGTNKNALMFVLGIVHHVLLSSACIR